MAEVLVQFADPVVAADGRSYVARACGNEMPDGLWQAWIEFLPVDEGEAVRSGRETTQPNRQDALYWATGLTGVYLEGALVRALKPLTRPSDPAIFPPAFDGPADESQAEPRPESILNPFSVYRKGETLLRNQLAALSAWHLVNIIQAHETSHLERAALERMPASALIELIVAGVRSTAESARVR